MKEDGNPNKCLIKTFISKFLPKGMIFIFPRKDIVFYHSSLIFASLLSQ
jgi:hypothetical protein